MLTMTFDDIIYATLDLLSVHMYIDWKVGRCVSRSDNTKMDNQLCKRDPFSELKSSLDRSSPCHLYVIMVCLAMIYFCALFEKTALHAQKYHN